RLAPFGIGRDIDGAGAAFVVGAVHRGVVVGRDRDFYRALAPSRGSVELDPVLDAFEVEAQFIQEIDEAGLPGAAGTGRVRAVAADQIVHARAAVHFVVAVLTIDGVAAVLAVDDVVAVAAVDRVVAVGRALV